MIKDKTGVQADFSLKITINLISYSCFAYSNSQIPQIVTTTVSSVSTDPTDMFLDFCLFIIVNFSHLAGMSPYISLKIKKRHYEHHMIEAHKYLITWIGDDSFKNSG